jgi:hypothetical protein
MSFLPKSILAIVLCALACANARASVIAAQSGSAELLYHPGAMAAFGLMPVSPNRSSAQQLTAVDAIQISAPNGHFQSFAAGLTPDLRLHMKVNDRIIDQSVRGRAGSDARSLDWIDAAGQIWLRFDFMHSQSVLGGSALRFVNGNARIGPALASAMGLGAQTQGALLGEGRLLLNLSAPLVSLPSQSSCSPPTWPSASAIADVALTDIGVVFQMRCSAPGCDGPASNNPKVVIAPSATLENVGDADIPWYQKFTGDFPPYGNDQHPFLIWNMFRIDADGLLRQIGQSGVKHAFFTVNASCSCGEAQILGKQCVDVYSALTNDTPTVGNCTEPDGCHQGPRNEILPARAEWARCGSIYDPDCDGSNTDTVPYTPFEHRMLVDEAELDETLLEKYLLESWYLVRDDMQTQNNIGTRFLNLDWQAPTPPSAQGRWNLINAGDFTNGTALQRWFNAFSAAGSMKRFTRVQTSLGSLEIVSRARALSATRWRYDYSIYNRDAALLTTSGAQPNLRMLDTRGVTRVSITLPSGAIIENDRFVDADLISSNDWGFARIADELLLSTQSNDLRWGTLYSFAFESDIAPGITLATLGFGTAASAHSAAVLGPSVERIFDDGFE